VNASPTLGQILRGVVQGSSAPTLRLSPEHWKVLRALAACRTPALGGQLFYCPACQREHFVAHSCRNRHCPQCQGAQALDWLAQQETALLPIPYFHLVFTLPHALNRLIRQNRRALFNLLFAAASQTLLEFGRQRLKAQIGISAVLHTWSQTLLDHYHLHCIVSGGGLALDGQHWVGTKDYYLFPVRALSRMFRGKFLAGLKGLYDEGKLEFHGQLQPLAQAPEFACLLRSAAKENWVVYAKRPFAGPQQVLKYLSNYTHRVAISNRRLIQADAHTVTFGYKDYADGARRKTMTLEVDEFVRRFALHLLPERFVKIRHYGLLGNRQRHQRLQRARTLLGVAAPAMLDTTTEPLTKDPPAQEPNARACCPFCRHPTLVLLREVPPVRHVRSLPVLDSS
jgi:hypothetical protein